MLGQLDDNRVAPAPGFAGPLTRLPKLTSVLHPACGYQTRKASDIFHDVAANVEAVNL
jgi:hypothetical protein